MTKQQNLTGQERCETTTASGRRCVERKDHRGSHRVDLGFGKLVKVY